METNKVLIKDEEAEDVDRPFDLEDFSDSDYAGASLDKKSTIRGCQFLGKRLISWQCKKQTIMANSTTEAEYVAVANSYEQVGDEVVHMELGDIIERAATTASSLEAEQDSGRGPSPSIMYALTENPTIYTSLIQQFWETASASTLENEEMEITATIDGRVKTITEASMKIGEGTSLSRRFRWYSHFTNAKILSKIALMGEPATMPHDSSQPRVQSLGSDEGTLTLNELTMASKSRRRTKIIVFDDEEVLEDPSKQGRIIAEIDQNPSISLVQDEGTSWIQEDAETQGRTSADTEILLDQEEPTELVEDPGSGEKGEKEISSAEVLVSTAIAILVVSTAIPERQVYIRRSAEKRKDKGKAIMVDDESVQKKTKKQLEQERLRYEKAIRLQEHINEEERQRIARDAEIAKQLQEDIDTARQEQEKYDLDKIDLQQKQSSEEEKLQKNDDSSKPSEGSRKKTLAKKRASEKQSEEGAKRQKIEDNTEKEELKAYLDIVPGEEFAMDVESSSTKYPMVDWKTHILTENFMYYQIIKADGSSKNCKIFSEMIDDFYRQDVMDLHRLVKQSYVTTSLEGYDLMMWGDLKTLFEPDEEDEV
ncbi:hypothetical protein Tco_0607876 [Tanacetum coccineum]